MVLLECMLVSPSNGEVDYGPIVSACQFVLTSIVAAIPLLDFSSSDLWKRGFLKPTHLPRRKLLIVVIMYFIVSNLNNAAWKYGLSVPVHTMFRSSGTVVSLAVGYFFGGKKYTRGQVMSCVLMSIGILMVVAQAELILGPEVGKSEYHGTWRLHCFGISQLFIACVLSAFMGLYTENLFKVYGRHWKESFFYLHFFSLPLFLIYSLTIKEGLREIWASLPSTFLFDKLGWRVPLKSILLFVNAISQVVCARGVNKLTSVGTALTITVVLLVRKFVSLIISSIIFGNTFNAWGIAGSLILVFGSIQYALYSIKAQDERSKKESAGDLKIS